MVDSFTPGVLAGEWGRIDLGEDGVWSAGIERLPSGTLLVLGPISLDQQAWDDAGQRVETGCLHALSAGHRVAVLVRTPTPESLFEDPLVLVRSASDEPSDMDAALVGVVTEDGDLQRREPFAGAYPEPKGRGIWRRNGAERSGGIEWAAIRAASKNQSAGAPAGFPARMAFIN